MLAGYSIIDKINFRILTDKDNITSSYASINNYELFDSDGQPISGGPFDARLGAIDARSVCATCSHGRKLCQGHRGHLELKVPILQPIAISEIRKWLKIVCFTCGAIVADRDKFMKFSITKRLTAASSSIPDLKQCPNPSCGAIHPKIIKDEEDHFTFWADYASELPKKKGRAKLKRTSTEVKLYPGMIKSIFEKVTNHDVKLLGRPIESHPRNLIMQTMNIPPNNIRQNTRSFEGGSSYPSNNPNLIQHIVRRNKNLPDSLPFDISGLPKDIDNSIQNLQQLIYDYIAGSAGTSATQGGTGKRGIVNGSKPVIGFLRLLPRKKGLIRSSLLGKRVFYISRSTISGNVSLKIDEVGIPMTFARVLQVMEVVQEFNKEWLMTFFLNGRKYYPGCTTIVKKGSKATYDVANLRDFNLEIGDILYRDVITGDLAYFGRQPTLTSSSLGVHKVVVMEESNDQTLQMNVLACNWYNADFDGDAMNLWIPRFPNARAEASILSSVTNQFISVKSSVAVVGQVQDSVIGSYELTRSDIVMDKYHAMSLFTSADISGIRFDSESADHIYTGRDIVSILLSVCPINYKKEPSSFNEVYAPFINYDKDEILTVIENGKMIKGVLDKKAIGAGQTGNIFHLISRDYGPQRALDISYALQQIVLQFLLYKGFTVGASDLIISREAIAEIRKLISAVLKESQIITDRLIKGEIIPPIDSTIHEFYEQNQIATLSVNESEILRWVLGSTNPNTNGFFKMISTGSKGSNPNLINVSGYIGQTKINGERIKESFAFRRTLPYFPRFATEPEAYGFVANSYMVGLTPSEFIFQSMNGRFDLINKALSTSTTGYFTRKLIMNLQSYIINNHHAVSRDITKILQFIYGEDGIDSRELEMTSLSILMMSDSALRDYVWFNAMSSIENVDLKERQKIQDMVDEIYEKVKSDRDNVRKSLINIENINFKQIFSTDFLLPVNVKRLVGNIISRNPKKPNYESIHDKIKYVNDFCDNLPYVLLNGIQERKKSRIPKHLMMAARLMTISTRSELNPNVLTKMTIPQIKYIAETIKFKYKSSLVSYGQAVGILSAQSLGQPLIQYMLDSHHRSVSGGTNKSGLVRVNEIFGAKPAHMEQSPAMLFPLREELLTDAKSAQGIIQDVSNSISFVSTEVFLKRYDILLEPYSTRIYPNYMSDAGWMKRFEESHPLIKIPNDLTNWCYRFVIDKSMLVLKSVDVELIVRKLRMLNSGLFVVHTPGAVSEIIIRIWCRASLFKKAINLEEKAKNILDEILSHPIRGISGIARTSIVKVKRHQINDNNEFIEKEIPMINTIGTNIYRVLQHNAVDKTKVISSSVGDTEKIYGIEAARNKIVSEIREFMAGDTPNLRHLFMIADEMTRTGKVTSIERTGLLSRDVKNVYLHMAYGDPIRIVTGATLNASESKIEGIAARQLLGSIPQIGSFYNSVIVDNEFVQKNIKSVDSVLDSL